MVVHLHGEDRVLIAEELEQLLENRSASSVDQEQVLKVFDGMIDRFSSYMATIPNPIAVGPLSNPEKALLKTFLVATFREKI
jgi:hypothetical protein